MLSRRNIFINPKSTLIFRIESRPPHMLNSKWSNKGPNFRWIMDSPSNLYDFINPIEKVKYLLVHYKEEL